MENIYCRLAREAISCFFNTGKVMSAPAKLPSDLLNKKAGVFVSLHREKDNSLRGCIGTIRPARENIAKEIICNAVLAAFKDPRFLPLSENELLEIKISVDILGEPEKLEKDIKLKLDPKKYGAIVSSKDGRKGLLLPNIKGVDTVEKQIEICRRKGGIGEDEEINIERFAVKRFEE